MRPRPTIWILLCLLLAAGAWLFWRSAEHRATAEKFSRLTTSTATSRSTAPKILSASNLSTNAAKTVAASVKTNPFAYRLTNTAKTIGELTRDDKAILLDNALIETGGKINLSIPKHLQSQGDPGSYIVQARGPIDNAFRAMLASAGAQIISYIPNNAYLVRVSAGGAAVFSGRGFAVLPYEPYYKISSAPVTAGQKAAAWSPSETNRIAKPTLLGLAVENKPLPAGTFLTLGLFGDSTAATIAQIEKLGGKVLSRDVSPFGPIVHVRPPANWTALAVLPGVQIVESAHLRKIANDLARVATGISTDTITATNYLGLTGKNVIVEVNDTGIDANHLDFSATGTAASGPSGSTRVFGDAAQSLTDTNGHGTHVAGIIAGNGSMSLNPVNVGTEAEGSISNADFRGKAPQASLYVIGGIDGGNDTNIISDSYFQQAAALTNALISNNSWVFDGDNAYDLEAASYDAATRDALPGTTGSQPVLFVFAAGNSGGGDDDGGGGNPDTIMSPATAKNVLAVGALEQLRNITNIVTNADGTVSTPWLKMTDSSFQVAGYSSRGNVGIGTEGAFGRYKPDVVAPGSFVVSTRSGQWDTNAYYNVTNDTVTQIIDLLEPDSLTDPPLQFFVFNNAVSVTIQANTTLGSPFVALPIYAWEGSDPNGPPTTPAEPDPITLPATPSNTGWACAASNTTSSELIYQLTVDVQTTNDLGNYYQVLEGMNDSLGGFYRYESGTSMSAPAVSGVLALIQDFFTNKLQITPSPALLKAMLINGARPTGGYDFNTANSINFQGWGLINLPDSLPTEMTNVTPGNLNVSTNSSIYLVDQSPTNTLSTGDSHTYMVKISDPAAQSLPLRVTLAWTDPPGNPAAAIKLVNDLNLVVTNLDDPTNPVVYYGNDIPAGSVFNSPSQTNSPADVDSINNVENVFLSPPLGGLLGTNYSVTVIGNRVNVNAVTAQTNNASGNFAPNVAQDFALVISSGAGEVSDALTVADMGTVSNSDEQITGIIATNTPLLNQIVGANPPLLDTNTVAIGTNTMWGTNGLVTLGLLNQWHFYVVTNNALDSSGNSSDVTNAAFVTFLPQTLSIPREGVFADSDADSTRPEADIDLYVTTDPGLTNLDPVTISNCLNGSQVGASQVGGIFNSASLGRGGTEFVVDSNSTPGQVYYVGVKSEDRMASEYDFLSVFTATPFSQTDTNGNVTVNGTPVPVNIPDGTPAHPGVQYVFGLVLDPTIQVGRTIVTNVIMHQNFGDLFGALSHNGTVDVLNSHDSPSDPPPPGPYTLIYDDSGQNDVPNSQPSDGPGSLNSFVGNQAFGAWILTEVDNSLGQTGSIQNFTMEIQPHHSPLGHGINISIEPGAWSYNFIDVPNGFTNLSVFATNLPPTSVPLPLQLYLNEGVPPDFTDFLLEADLTNCIPGTGNYPSGTDPGNSISYGPPLQPDRYWVGIFNPGSTTANVFLLATLGGVQVAPQQTDFSTNGPPLLDDAVTTNSIFVSATNQIVSVNVGLVVDHPRISDLTFTLVSPSGQRVLLMENRGGLTATNLGDVFYTTNFFPQVTASGGASADTNFLNVGETSGQLTINYNFYTVPDEMTIYYGTNISPPNLIFDSGFTNNPGTSTNTVQKNFTVTFGPGTSTFVTIIMNQFGNTNGAGGDAWTYTAGGIQTNYNYAIFTEDTNLTQTPIKFAVPPFDMAGFGTNFTLSDFELATNGDYFATTNIFDAFGGWSLFTNQITDTNNLIAVTNELIFSNEVSVVTDPSTALAGSNYLALADGTISRVIPLTIGEKYSINYWYRGPGISGWWRGEGNATDSSDPENNGNNGSLIGRFDFPAGEVGQAFQFEDLGEPFEFAGTNNYVQIRQSPSLDVGARGGLTVEGWINPTNISHQEPLVEWLAQMPTNGSDTNLVIEAGPFLNRATSHYYYLLRATNWVTSEFWATQLGGHLVTVDTANEENWVFDTFGSYGNTNRNLWIGLTNGALGSFIWSSGLTNIVYTNWANGQPDNTCGTADFTFIVNNTTTNAPNTNSPGLWALANNNGFTCANPATTNVIYGVVEVDELQTNGVQFWISVTNTPDATNLLVNADGSILTNTGCLYANLVDVSNLSHEIFSAPGLIQTNVYQHVALTYSTNTGIANLYYNGTNVASTNLGVFIPKTGGDVLLGKDMSLGTNDFYGGEMDEMSIYSRPLSDAEIRDIYEISNLSTNRNVGKFDPSVTPAQGLAEAQVSFSGTTNLIFGENNIWQEQGFTFTAVTNSASLQFKGLEPGMLLDSFNVSAVPLGNLYYLPEQSLDELTGSSAFGTWTLEVWDNRTGAFVTNANQLINWQLQFVLQTNVLATPLPLDPQDPTTITVPPGQIVYLSVAVPSWANFATNILVSASGPVDLLFNQTNPPTGSNPNDFTFVANNTSGSYTISNNPVPPPQLLPGQTYFLGVKNSGTHAVSAVVEVDFDITTLSNNIPVGGVLNTNDSERYFAFDVSSNAFEATFQLLHLSSNADLVVRKGAPLPTLLSSDYGSFNSTNADENIYVLTNSSPVPLSQGRWYLGVFKRDSGPVDYTVLAKELDATNGVTGTTIIDLTNGVPFDFTSGSGAALTNFFRFTVTNTITSTVTNYVSAVRFQLYNQSGNGDLTVQTNAPPFAPPFFQSSQNPNRDEELIDIRTNSALTNLAASWYLGVPDNETNQITYTILAVIVTNNVFPAFPGAEGAGAGALGGRGGDVYHVVNLNDDGLGSLRYGINNFFGTGATNVPGTGTTNLADGSITNITGARTIVFDVSGTIELLSPLVITNSYLTIAGQTAPGGVTVAGDMTAVQSAHDVVIRYVRFRPGYLTPGNDLAPVDSLKLTNVSDVVADHISASWSTNALVSALNSSNVTVQWSVIADSLNNTNAPHGYGSVLRYGNGSLSFHHNLYADNYNASPRLGDNLKLDFINNVIYDWGTNAGFSTNETLLDDPFGFTNELNYECNYLIAGSNSVMTNIAFFGGTTNTWIFQTNNFMDSNKNGILDGDDIGWNMFTNQFTEFGRSFASSPVSIDEAFLAYERVQDFAGAAMGQRDLFDTNIVGKVRTQSGAIISTAPLSGLVAWWKAENNANDSASTNNGTVQNVFYTNGVVGHAFTFDPETYNPVRVRIADNPVFILTNSLSIEGWVRPRGNGYIIFYRGDSRSGYDPYLLSMQDNSNILFQISDVNNNSDSVGAGVYIPYNAWSHVAGTLDGNSGLMSLYVNGILVSQKTTSIRPLGSLVAADDPGIGIGNLHENTGAGFPFYGDIDEISLYNRALSSNEIGLIYAAGSGGKLFLSTTPPPLDTDRDGIPDYWETTLGENPTNFSANADRDGDGYTDLEEYMNWLAAPHALTVTNTPVSVDLYALCGKTGNLSFSVTNGINGSVYLTNVLGSVTNTGAFSNSIAVFTPATNSLGTNFYGYASFDFDVTNNATIAAFGPVTVSVMVSAVPVVSGAVTLLTTNAPVTNSIVIASNSLAYFSIFAPANADFATNILKSASGNLNLWFNQNMLPSGSNPGDFELLTNLTSGKAILTTNGAPVPSVPSFAPGEFYYLALQNTNSSAVTVTNFALEVDFHLVNATNPVFEFSGVILTGSSIQLQWSASLGAQVQVQWTTNLVPPVVWNTITNPAVTQTNGVSTFTDDGSQTAPLGEMRFYRLMETSP
jgi:subtilisin-like proprotein convertase family protein